MPNENILKQTLESTFVNSVRDGTQRIDLCCRTLHKCDAQIKHTLNETIEVKYSNCDCAISFLTCLKNLNTDLSNELSLMFTINNTKCYSNDHPIVNCVKYEEINNINLMNFTKIDERENYFKRCSKYNVDPTQKKRLQFFDLPFNKSSGTYYTCTRI